MHVIPLLSRLAKTHLSRIFHRRNIWQMAQQRFAQSGSEAKGINKYGFERFVGFYAGALDYYSKGSTGWFHDEKPAPSGNVIAIHIESDVALS